MALKTNKSSRGGLISKLAYLDSSALIAFLDRSDSYFPIFSLAFTNPPKLVTTSLVITETHGWFLKRYDRYRATKFLQFIETLPDLEVLPIGKQELKQGAGIIEEFKDQDLTMVDAVGLWIIRARKLRICWSTDRHLSLTKAQLLIHINK